MADKKHHTNRRLQYLSDLKDYKMAKGDPDVRGWTVVDADNTSVGTIAGLLADPVREKVIYLDVDIRDDILSPEHDPFDAQHEDGIHEYQDKEGEIHMIIPVGAAHIDRSNKKVIADGIDQAALREFPSYRYRKNTPIHPDYERKVKDEYLRRRGYVESEDGKLIARDVSDDEYYNSEHFDEDHFYGRNYRKL